MVSYRTFPYSSTALGYANYDDSMNMQLVNFSSMHEPFALEMPQKHRSPPWLVCHDSLIAWVALLLHQVFLSHTAPVRIEPRAPALFSHHSRVYDTLNPPSMCWYLIMYHGIPTPAALKIWTFQNTWTSSKPTVQYPHVCVLNDGERTLNCARLDFSLRHLHHQLLHTP